MANRDAGYLGFVPVSLTLAMNSPSRSTIPGGRSICSMIAAAAGSFSMQSMRDGALLEDLHVPEPGGLYKVDVGLLVDRAGQAADVRAHRLLDGLGEPLQHDRVGDHQPSAGPQHAEGLAEDLLLVGREVDDAVGDDDVDRGVGHRAGARSRRAGTRRSCTALASRSPWPARASPPSCPRRSPARRGRPGSPRGSSRSPGPEPRSSTVSPGFREASAMGLPHPRPRLAPLGTARRSSSA